MNFQEGSWGPPQNSPQGRQQIRSLLPWQDMLFGFPFEGEGAWPHPETQKNQDRAVAGGGGGEPPKELFRIDAGIKRALGNALAGPMTSLGLLP